MNCIVVDDEPLAVKWLEKLITDTDSLHLLGTFTNALHANGFLKSSSVDLLFLDIQMSSLNGLDFMKSLVEPPLVIFVTAYSQFALESYELDAVDYLLKPVRMERFLKSVNKASDYFSLLRNAKDRNTSLQVGNDHIFVRSDKRFVKLFFEDILVIEGLKDYVVIKTADKQKVITAMNIKTILEQLPQNIFARVSKSHIVNANHIKSLDSNHVFINNEEIPIGNLYRDPFYQAFVTQKVLKR
jgi:DNA-binding LytR/AlgR family response regulator